MISKNHIDHIDIEWFKQEYLMDPVENWDQ